MSERKWPRIRERVGKQYMGVCGGKKGRVECCNYIIISNIKKKCVGVNF